MPHIILLTIKHWTLLLVYITLPKLYHESFITNIFQIIRFAKKTAWDGWFFTWKPTIIITWGKLWTNSTVFAAVYCVQTQWKNWLSKAWKAPQSTSLTRWIFPFPKIYFKLNQSSPIWIYEACQDDQKKMTELDLVGWPISLITINLTYFLDQLPPIYSWGTWLGVRHPGGQGSA